MLIPRLSTPEAVVDDDDDGDVPRGPTPLQPTLTCVRLVP